MKKLQSWCKEYLFTIASILMVLGIGLSLCVVLVSFLALSSCDSCSWTKFASHLFGTTKGCEIWSASGQIISAIGAVCTMVIATAALMAYIHNESVENEMVEEAWKACQQLKNDLFYYSQQVGSISARIAGASGKITEPQLKDFALKQLGDSCKRAYGAPLGYLDKIKCGDGNSVSDHLRMIMLALEMHEINSECIPSDAIIKSAQSILNKLQESPKSLKKDIQRAVEALS